MLVLLTCLNLHIYVHLSMPTYIYRQETYNNKKETQQKI